MNQIKGAPLLELAERLEKAAGPDRELDARITVAMAAGTGLVELAGPDCAPGTYWVTLDGGGKSLKTATPWTASLDAAMTLYIRDPERDPSNPRLAAAEALRQRAEAA
jgi:hypothetical protein